MSFSPLLPFYSAGIVGILWAPRHCFSAKVRAGMPRLEKSLS